MSHRFAPMILLHSFIPRLLEVNNHKEERQSDDILYFSSTKLCGREAESAALLDACKNVLSAIGSSSTNNDGETGSAHRSSITALQQSAGKESTGTGKIVLVSGLAGAGKSELVRRAVCPWITRDCHGYFVD
eukprot:15324978-Ditylum_brightwellii.AAC.1